MLNIAELLFTDFLERSEFGNKLIEKECGVKLKNIKNEVKYTGTKCRFDFFANDEKEDDVWLEVKNVCVTDYHPESKVENKKWVARGKLPYIRRAIFPDGTIAVT